MTVINLYTADQHLIAAQKVKIASGDVESVQLQVVFDDAWNDYVARTAVFHTLKNTTPVEMLLTDDACVVPHEVLAEAGTLFIGVRGATLDGTAIKTSTLVKYKIEQGADAGYTTLNPTMDLYQQFLAAMDERVDPITEEFRADIEKFKQDVLKSLEGDVLWENPDTSVVFAAQTIALDLSEYTNFVIVYLRNGGRSEMSCHSKDVTYNLHHGNKDRADVYTVLNRKFYISDSGVTFDDCLATDSQIFNGGCKPIRIIGYKSGGIATA